MKRLTDNELDALETVYKAAKLPDSMRILSAPIRVHAQGPDLCSNDQHEDYCALAHNALPALLDEVRELRRKEEHMRRFAASMADDGDPVLLGFAYYIQVILDGNNGG
jgi:hypothetical protein